MIYFKIKSIYRFKIYFDPIRNEVHLYIYVI